ncbi:MAG: hypothetical protein ACPKQO_07980 [Nitrososphaeraceae archaeon]
MESSIERIYGEKDIVAQELFNNTAVFMSDWKAVKNTALGDTDWKLFNITKDIGENNNLADKHPEILQELITGYDIYAKENGVIIPIYDDYNPLNEIGVE